jgi:hypothetical protein
MGVDLTKADSEKRFEEMCQALLAEEFARFQAFSPPDLGMDGFDSDSGTIFQAYFPDREPRRDKIRDDLEKAKRQGDACRRWVLLLPKNPTPGLSKWLKEEEQPSCLFPIEVWGKTKLHGLLAKHKRVRDFYFPTDLRKELERLAKGLKPGVGDAAPGLEISAEQAEEIREMIEKLAEDEAKRKKRKRRDFDFHREYGEFNAHFKLSFYRRLPREKMNEARRHLETKMHARRGYEPVRLKRNRLVGGIKGIAKALGMGETRYRQVLPELTGKRSTTEMDMKELERVFEHFKQLQGLEEARRDSAD